MKTSRIFLYLTAATSVLIALMSYRFLFLGLSDAFSAMAGHIAARPTTLLVHVAASPVALGLAAFQFLPNLRTNKPAWHRWAGRAYALAIFLGGISGLILAMKAEGGAVASWGFGLLSVIWLAATAYAVRLAMEGRYAEHRKWMIRSFALTFAAVTFRLYFPVFIFGFGMDYPQASQWLTWICWIPNLIFAEFWIARVSRQTAKAA